MSAGVVTGLQNSGVCATLKHFPGLGAGDGNTHRGSVYIERTLEELEQAEFPAFQGGIAAGADFVMVGHQITSGSGDNLPGDLSSVVITQWLKNELGFQGIVITDAQNMGAITANYSPGEAAVQSFSAGVDIVLMPDDLPEAVDAVVKAVENGTLEESSIDESVTKILTKKEKSGLLS
jgi:beta-N-acetylhexosaminidase